MNPSIETYLRELARALAQDFAPRMPAAYDMSTLTRHALLIGLAAEEFDRAAARRVEENGELRRLFADAARVVQFPDLRQRLLAASETRDDSLTVSALETSNRALRRELIALHEHVEHLTGVAARSLEDAIWRELARSTERRRTSIHRS